MASNLHKRGKALHPPGKFGFKHSRIPMKAPNRSKKHHGRRGGVRS